MANTIKKGILFVISGPSGAGKSTLVKEALDGLNNFTRSISVTTRPKRPDENAGENYYFLSQSEFKKMIDNNEFLEWVDYCGYYYGTPKSFVEGNLNKGLNMVLEIEVIGAMQVKKNMPESYLIFITVPDVNDLNERLRKRATECDEAIARRIEKAKEEMKYEKYYDCIIVNNNYNEALKNLKYVLTSESGGNL
ncbi:guanylate kinase [bacterium]|nr:guanylate kinase [bacterium]